MHSQRVKTAETPYQIMRIAICVDPKMINFYF